MTNLRFVYVTTPTIEEAQLLAKELVGARLAACANILPGMQSVSWWEGQITDNSECVLILKTTAAQVPLLQRRVRELHSYECPCIASLAVDAANENFLAWVLREAKPS